MDKLSYKIFKKKKLNGPKELLISINFLLNNYYPITSIFLCYQISFISILPIQHLTLQIWQKRNFKYRVPRPAPTGYPDLKPVKSGTHQVQGLKKFYPKLEHVQPGPFFGPRPGPSWTGSGFGPDGSIPGPGLGIWNFCSPLVAVNLYL